MFFVQTSSSTLVEQFQENIIHSFMPRPIRAILVGSGIKRCDNTDIADSR